MVPFAPMRVSSINTEISSTEDPNRKNPKSNKNAHLSKWHVTKEALVASGGEHKPWNEMSAQERIESTGIITIKLLLLILIIFWFICTLGLLSDAFKLIGGKGLANIIKKSHFLSNPISATIIGMLFSMILQSSSTLISILVGMVAAKLITVHQAVPIVIGGEMGSSLMNVLVSMGQSGNGDQFRRAFACATMSDAFNLMNYLTVLPLEIAFGILENLSDLMVKPLSHVRTKEFKAIQLITDPILHKIVKIDSDALTRVSAIVASENTTAMGMVDRKTFIYRCIDLDTLEKLPFCPYQHIFANSILPDQTIGFILLAMSIVSLVLCLIGVVNIMTSLLGGQVAMLVNRLVTYNFPQPFKFLTGYMLMAVAALIVVVIESSSVFRSALTPLVGLGVIPLERYYCFVVGSNVGTTSTGVLAALASDPAQLKETLQIAFCQTLYNLFGVILFYPIPFLRRIPLKIAMKLGDTTAKYRWFPIVYIISIFFLMPGFFLALSLLPSEIILTIVGVIVVFIATLVLINWLQVVFPLYLPSFLRNWKFLPDWMHSLRPYDKVMVHLCESIPCCPRRFFSPSPSSFDEEKDPDNKEDTQYKRLSKQTTV